MLHLLSSLLNGVQFADQQAENELVQALHSNLYFPHQTVADELVRRLTTLRMRRDNVKEEIAELTTQLDSLNRAIEALEPALAALEDQTPLRLSIEKIQTPTRGA